MKLLIEKSSLEPALRRLIGVVDKRNTIAILSNVMITTQEGRIQLRVTDLDMEAVDVAACAVDTPGAITVEAGKLYDIVRNFQPGSNILFELTADDPRLTVSAGRSRFRLPVLPVSDFPALQAQEWATTFMVPAADLAGIFARSSYAMGNDTSRYFLNGVYLQTIDGVLRGSATDGKRMGYGQIPHDASSAIAAIIPTKMVNEVMRRVAEWDGDVMVCVRPGRICLITGDAAITSKLIDGDYPDYVRTIPTTSGTIVSVDGDALTAAVRSAILVNADKTPGARITLTSGCLTVTGRGNDADAVDEITVDYEGDEIWSGANANYLLQAISALNADILDLEFRGQKYPLIIRKPGDDTCFAMVGSMATAK